MTFGLDVDSVDSGWLQAANAPDAVSFSLHADDQTVSTYEWLHSFLRLYEVVQLHDSVTDSRFSVFAFGDTIHIVYRRSDLAATCSTTYADGSAEITTFLETVFRHLDANSDDGEREGVAPWLDAQLRELTLTDIYTDVAPD